MLLSTDVYTYWDYARISTEHGGNPYVDVPNDYPDDPALPLMGSHWRDTTSVYGPGFTLASEGHAVVVGGSPDAAAWLYRALAAAAMVVLVLLAARLSPQPAVAAAFVGAYAWLLREAWRGRVRLALTACFLLICTSWLVPWYAVWAVPLAAVEEDRTARILALALSAYMLRDAVPI